MADFEFNQAKGRIAELGRRVDGGDPANARFLAVVINTTEVDGALQDLDTLAAVLGNANTAEVTNAGYARITLTSTEITVTVDDSGNVQNVSVGNLDFGAITAGDGWTDILICYIPDGVTPGADTTVVPLTQHDFAITPDGSNVTATEPAGGFFAAT